MKLLKKIITLLIVFSAMNINMLYGDVVYDFGTHVIICFGDGDGHGGYLVGECITFYRDDQKRDENNSGGGSGITGTSGSSTFTPTPTTTDEPTGGSGGTTGGTGTIGDDTVTDKPTLDDNKPPLEEPEPICRCSECEVCGGCILDAGEPLPKGCEKMCDCPPPCECCGNNNCDRTCQVVATTTLVNPPDASKNFSFNGGQKVIVRVRNNNILGVTMRLTDEKELDNNSIGSFIGPGMTYEYTASMFGETPIWWIFSVSTVSDAASLGISANSCFK